MATRYWDIRKDFEYYRRIKKFITNYVPGGGSLIDVGSGLHAGCKFLETVPTKYAKTSFEDCKSAHHIRGVKELVGDIYDLEGKYDIVVCSQVLEHLERPEEAFKKLRACAKRLLIISVPYKWREGAEPGHVQDPVDEHKLFGWTNLVPTESHIVSDKGLRRLICVYDFRHDNQ